MSWLKLFHRSFRKTFLWLGLRELSAYLQSRKTGPSYSALAIWTTRRMLEQHSSKHPMTTPKVRKRTARDWGFERYLDIWLNKTFLTVSSQAKMQTKCHLFSRTWPGHEVLPKILNGSGWKTLQSESLKHYTVCELLCTSFIHVRNDKTKMGLSHPIKGGNLHQKVTKQVAHRE